MSNKQITELNVSGPLDNAEVILGVQAGATVQIPIRTLRASPFPEGYTVTYVYNEAGDISSYTCHDGFRTWTATLAYTNDDITSLTVTNGLDTWIQTITYLNDQVSTVSAWVKQ